MTKFTVGAQMYSVRTLLQTEEDMKAAFAQLKAMGYNEVQMSGYNFQIPPERIAALLEKAGLHCGATHVSFDWMEEDVDRCIAYHKALKCEYAGTGSMPRHFVERGEEGFVDFAKRASKVAEKLQDAGQHFLYHNHAFELAHYSKGRGLEILFNETSPAFQFEIDVFWIQAGGMNPIDWIHKVAGRMDVVHFKDMKPTCTITEIGNGNLDWPKIMAACDEIGVKYAFIEQDNAVESDPLNCMKISHDYLAPLGAKF